MYIKNNELYICPVEGYIRVIARSNVAVGWLVGIARSNVAVVFIYTKILIYI